MKIKQLADAGQDEWNKRSDKDEYLEVHPFSKFWKNSGNKAKQLKLIREHKDRNFNGSSKDGKLNKPRPASRPSDPKVYVNKPNKPNRINPMSSRNKALGKVIKPLRTV